MNNDLGVRIQELRNRLGAADVIIQMFIHGKNMPRKKTQNVFGILTVFLCYGYSAFTEAPDCSAISRLTAAGSRQSAG
ncbi:hypothetical protein JOE32_000915 [Pseudomonas sp. PvP025]|nr:hypothetical protein [Pseudomonas sp. PvP025]MDQ0398308.1 hypothetical protein [Pseudomonas sp. PvP006]